MAKKPEQIKTATQRDVDSQDEASRSPSGSTSKRRNKKTIYTWSNPAPPVKISFSGTGAKQSFKNECEINNILNRFTKTGVIEHLNKHQPQYGDLSGFDFREAQNTLATAKTMFEELPARTREAFDNDPAAFLDFVSDETNASQLYDLGLTATPIAPPEQNALTEPLSDEVTNPEPQLQ